jgi:hypothetical protein
MHLCAGSDHKCPSRWNEFTEHFMYQVTGYLRLLKHA